jgi:uncharacterized protein
VRHSFKLALLFALATLCVHAEPVASLHPTNYVNDFAGVLDASTVAQLNDLCKQVDEKAHAQISVVTVKSLDGQDVFNYAVALYQAWGIGKKGSDRGVLILQATQDRKFGASIGYGLEAILPDGKVGGFRREVVPYLARGDYAAGLTLMTSRIASVIAQDAGVTLEGIQAPPAPRSAPNPGDQGAGPLIGILFVIIVVVIVWAIVRGGGGGYGRGGGFWSGLLWGILLNSMGGKRGGYGGGGGFGGGGFGGGGFGGGGGGFGGFGGGSTGGGGSFGGY